MAHPWMRAETPTMETVYDHLQNREEAKLNETMYLEQQKN